MLFTEKDLTIFVFLTGWLPVVVKLSYAGSNHGRNTRNGSVSKILFIRLCKGDVWWILRTGFQKHSRREASDQFEDDEKYYHNH